MITLNTITEEEFKTIEKTRRDISITLYKAELPEGIHGFTRLQRNGSYQIFLNSSDSQERQTATFIHECMHIYHEDHKSPLPATEIEAIRHRDTADILKTLKEH